jgi:tetratricopeptide (TPR) repeat protein
LLRITQIPENEWVTTLRAELEHAGLLVVEHIPGYTELHSRIFHPILNPYLRFHPVLTPFLRSQIKEVDHLLGERYALHYGSLVEYLHLEDNRNPRFVRKLVQRELPNFQHAFEFWLEAGDLETTSVLAERIAHFLDILGYYRQRDELRRQAAIAIAATITEGQLTFAEYTYRNNLGDQALKKGDILAGHSHFDALLKRFETQSEDGSLGRNSYEHCITLEKLAHCLRESGQLGLAIKRLREALAIITTLREYLLGNHYFIHVHCMLLVDLGDVLRTKGEYAQSEMAYREALKMAQRIGNVRDLVVCLGQLGTLALVQRSYMDARLLYTEELKFMRKLNEPAMEGDLWYQLGLVAFEQGDLVEAERSYRESIAITDRLEDDTATAKTCNGLAMIAQQTERPFEAEHWLKRALTIAEHRHPQSDLHAIILNNLAFLLTQGLRAGQLSSMPTAQDARHYALQALAIAEALGSAAEAWRPLGILADIAELEGKVEEVQEYRRRVRETFAAFKGNRTTIDRVFSPVILAIVAAVKGDVEVQSIVEVILPFETEGFHVTDAVQRLCAGERDWHSLTEDMDPQSALIILRVLETLASSTHPQATEEQDRM